MDSCGIITGFDTYANITKGISQNTVEDPAALANGVPYCSTSYSNVPINGGTYMQQYQWRACSCSITGSGTSTLKDNTYASICNSECARAHVVAAIATAAATPRQFIRSLFVVLQFALARAAPT